MDVATREQLLEKIRELAESTEGRRLTRENFVQKSGFKVSDIFRFFPTWSEALAAAGIEVEPYNQRIDPAELLKDWGEIVRREREIPSLNYYKIHGTFSKGVFNRNFGAWSNVPSRFREFAKDKPEWADVVTLLPPEEPISETAPEPVTASDFRAVQKWHSRLQNRPTYGDPIDFRGLRHAPVNEQGVVFLFGMVARELGYMVEAVQTGFPDCEAKRQISPNKWQPVRIEFEFESKHYLEHGHSTQGCDLVVCWVHNWSQCPPELEILELSSVIKSLSKSDE